MSASSMRRCPACCRSSTPNAWRQAVRTGLGLNAQINNRSVFDRKNYFYPDLPQGYQISQYKSPIVGEGEIVVDPSPTEQITVGIERLHLEQDAGKSLHDQHPTMSFVDLNRSGVALMEIVSRPDLRSADEARAYVTKLRTILRYLGTCDGDMEKGIAARRRERLRCASRATLSARAARSRTSTRSASSARRSRPRRAARSASSRMAARSTRRRASTIPARARRARCAPRKKRTTTATSPIRTCCRWNSTRPSSTSLKGALPELPDAKKARFIAEYGLSPYDASVLVAERDQADFFEAGRQGPRTARPPPTGSSTSSSAASTRRAWTSTASPVSAAQLGGLVDLIGEGTISGKIAKDLFEILWTEGGDPRQIVEARGMKQVTDTGAIEKVVDEIIAANPDKVEQAKVKPTMLGWFVGQAMKASGGKANPQALNEILKKKLGIE